MGTEFRSRQGRANRVRGVLAALIAVCAACVLAPSPALAGTLDQQQTIGGGNIYAVDTYESVAQTFTAGLSGGLDQVDLDISKYGSSPSPANLSVEIRDAPGGLPGSTVLASQSVPASSVGFSLAFVAINFPTPASVVAGTQYAIVAYTSASGYAWAASSTANPYADGDSFVAPSSPPSTSWNPQAGDQAFKTYVVPTPSVVPPTPSVVPPTTSTPAPTGQRAAALNKCKKKHSKKARKKCKKKANLLPV